VEIGQFRRVQTVHIATLPKSIPDASIPDFSWVIRKLTVLIWFGSGCNLRKITVENLLSIVDTVDTAVLR